LWVVFFTEQKKKEEEGKEERGRGLVGREPAFRRKERKKISPGRLGMAAPV